MSNSPDPSNDYRPANLESIDSTTLPGALDQSTFDLSFGGSLSRFRALESPSDTSRPPARTAHGVNPDNAPDLRHGGTSATYPPGRFLDAQSGIRFHSRSEAACAAIMERFIPGYQAIEGVTYEVPLGPNGYGHMRRVDFRVGDTLIEFHPVRLWRHGRHFGDFKSREDWREFLSEYRRCPKRDRPEFKRETMRELNERYYHKRLAAIRANPELAHTELVVATNAADFYEKVIVRFSPEPPTLEEFCELFNEGKAEVTDLRFPQGKHHGRRPRKHKGR